MKVLNVREEPGHEKQEMEILARRAQDAAMDRLNNDPAMKELTEEQFKAVKRMVSHLSGFILHEDDEPDYPSHHADFKEAVAAGHAIVLDAARAEVSRARDEKDTDPEVADKVLRHLDHRTVIIED
jgi:CPA1 family monovalent cation:H+ antiporter